MIISSWNVNSVRARINNIKEYLKKSDPDIVMMQEIKTEEKNYPFDEFKRLETYCVENPKEDKLKPIYEALGSNIDYGKIRLVLEYIKTKK